MNPQFFQRRVAVIGAFFCLVAGHLRPTFASYPASKLTAPDAAQYHAFGVAAAMEGDSAIVGAWTANNQDGAAYVYDARTGEFRFKLGPTVTSSQFFGYSVALSGDKAVIGQWFGYGSAYVVNIETGEHLFRLRAADESFDDKFGTSVDITGNTVIVGSPNDKDRGFGSGSAYLFDAATGAQIRKIVPADNAAGDNFGVSVAIDGARAVIGAWRDNTNLSSSGSAYVFDTTSGQQLMKLTASDAHEDNEFGVAVAIDGNYALISGRGNDHAANHSGAAYVFDITTGQQLWKLTADDAAPGDEFGKSVSLHGDIAMVGAWRNDAAGDDAGAAYLFDIRNGQQIAKLVAPDAAVMDEFGHGVAYYDGRALVGAWHDGDAGQSSGSAYLFRIPEPSGIVLLLAPCLMLNVIRRGGEWQRPPADP